MALQVLTLGQRTEWREIVERMPEYDFYHLPDYHHLETRSGDGVPHCFIYREDSYTIALPLVLRPLGGIQGLSERARDLRDATSVYGYAGPIASHADLPAHVIQGFHKELTATLRDLRVVAVFSRLHPFIPQRHWLMGLGDHPLVGDTVAIDLTLPPDVQRAQYRKNHKQDINRLRALGMSCVHDTGRLYLAEFTSIYHETMRRVGAAPHYFFHHSYLDTLTSSPQLNMQLFAAVFRGQVVSAGLFSLCNGIVQYHLGGTHGPFLPMAPMKLIFEGVRLWANEQRARVFHLGGGVGAQEDALFHFKAGFSKSRHQFYLWRWINLPVEYRCLVDEKQQWNEQQGIGALSTEYFPTYRSPVQRAQAVAEAVD